MRGLLPVTTAVPRGLRCTLVPVAVCAVVDLSTKVHRSDLHLRHIVDSFAGHRGSGLTLDLQLVEYLVERLTIGLLGVDVAARRRDTAELVYQTEYEVRDDFRGHGDFLCALMRSASNACTMPSSCLLCRASLSESANRPSRRSFCALL